MKKGRKTWYKKEFKDIHKQIKNKNFLSQYDFLRIRNYKLNLLSVADRKEVTNKTKVAFKKAKEGEHIEAIRSLQDLSGVGIPIASAILAMKFPNKYAIIDNRVLTVMKKKARNKSEKKRYEKMLKRNHILTPSDYIFYLERIKESKPKGKSLRDHEFELFNEYDKIS